MTLITNLTRSAFGLLATLPSLAADTQPATPMVFSRVGDLRTQTVPLPAGPQAEVRVGGQHPEWFQVGVSEGGGRAIEFAPTDLKGLAHATLEVTDGDVVTTHELRGLATLKLEGKNEPPLQQIFSLLGIETDPGGTELHLKTAPATIGDSLAVSEFRVADGVEEVAITLLARYSPTGLAEVGFALDEGKTLKPFGVMGETTAEAPDAHQRVFPPAESEGPSFSGNPNFKVPAKACPDRFGFYYAGKHYTSLTYPGKAKKAKIAHTARVYPVPKWYRGPLENAYLICFEEATNGDYQDAVLLVEGLEPMVAP